MNCAKITQAENYVPVCASVVCEAPGVIYINIDPELWKIRCRQCQEKTEHKCVLKKLSNKYRRDPLRRRKKEQDEMTVKGEKINEENKNGRGGSSEQGGGGGGGGGGGRGSKAGDKGKADDKDEKEEDKKAKIFKERSKFGRLEKGSEKGKKGGADDKKGGGAGGGGGGGEDEEDLMESTTAPPIFKPTNFAFQVEVSGEFKPVHVPKFKKGKEQSN